MAREVAVEISKTLEQHGFSVDVIPVLEKPQEGDYQFAIIGSAVYMSSWRPEAIELVKDNQVAPNRVPVAFNSGRLDAALSALSLQRSTPFHRSTYHFRVDVKSLGNSFLI